MAQPLALADHAIIVGFFVVMLAIGFYFSSRMKDLKDYFSGGREVPWWLSGASLYMSSFSAFAFVSYSALAYRYGFVSLTLWWVTVPAMILSATVFAARWRRAASTSPLEYIEERYGPALRQGLAWLGVPMTLLDDGLKLFAIGALVAAALGTELNTAILISGGLVLAYTFMGGLWAVLVTDFVQFVVMVAAVLVLVPLTFSRVGGWGNFMDGIPDGFFAATADKYGPLYLLAFLAIMALGYCTRWSFVQRYYAVPTDGDARKVGYMVAALNLVSAPLMFFPAMAARVYMPGIEDTNQVYALVCKELLPVGMVGMMIAAMFSATMSMLSGDYNVVASVLTNDVYKRLVAPMASDQHLVRAGRAATILAGLISLGVGLLVAGAQGEDDLFQLMVRLFGVFLPPIAIPMMLGLLSRRVSYPGAMSGFLFGIAVGLAAYFLGGFHPNLRWEPVITTLTVSATLVGVIGGTWATPNSPQRSERIDQFLAGLSAHEIRHSPRERKQVNVFPVIGVSVAALGGVTVAALLLTAPLSQSFMGITVGGAMLLVGLACGLWPRMRG
ncbi:MAG: sodium/solute symporter [Candidatus Omnitrophica bacterium]|nr:hypothetical protein [bacterium]NUN95288.1 sodium/solute symporter [Candidatus Omnitrophota bacterium]